MAKISDPSIAEIIKDKMMAVPFEDIDATYDRISAKHTSLMWELKALGYSMSVLSNRRIDHLLNTLKEEEIEGENSNV